MHSQPEAFPVTMDIPGTSLFLKQGFGGMTAAYWKMSSVDSRPMLKGLTDDCCPCPHWGYMLKGSMKISYKDGTEETVKAGEMFYFPAGHNGYSDEEVEWIEFSPEKELKMVMEHLAKQK